MKKILISTLIILLLLSTVAFVGCDNGNYQTQWNKYTRGEFEIKNARNPFVEITFSTGDKVRLELYPDQAPITVENFINLAKRGYYDGLTMHRIIKNFMIQGGGYVRDDNSEKGTILKEPNSILINPIKGEFKRNGVNNTVSHLKGVISMARTTNYNSATSQFFICSVDYTYLDGEYAAFGRVIDEESMKAVVKLSHLATDIGYIDYDGFLSKTTDVPTTPITIEKVEVYS